MKTLGSFALGLLGLFFTMALLAVLLIGALDILRHVVVTFQ